MSKKEENKNNYNKDREKRNNNYEEMNHKEIEKE
jgi:hypothetical protein